MLEDIYQELTNMQERMHRKSKERFREYLRSYANSHNLGYRIFPVSRITKNVVIGSLRDAKVILGAHYDTPPRMPALLMKSVLVFNLLIYSSTMILMALMARFPDFSTFFFLMIMLMFIYSLGLFAIANKYNFNDNTSGILTMLHLMSTLKDQKVAYVFFDNEEKGLLGSMDFVRLYRNKYDVTSKKFIILDCVGRGDTFMLMSYNNLMNLEEIKKANLELSTDDSIIDSDIDKSTLKKYQFMIRKPSMFEMSDHYSLKKYSHVGIMCYNKKGKKYILENIHSHKDRAIDLMNIKVLSATIKNYIRQGE